MFVQFSCQCVYCFLEIVVVCDTDCLEAALPTGKTAQSFKGPKGPRYTVLHIVCGNLIHEFMKARVGNLC